MDKPSKVKKLTNVEIEARKVIARSLEYPELINYCQAEDPRVCSNDIWKEVLRRDFPKIYQDASTDYQSQREEIERHNRRAQGKVSPKQTRHKPSPSSEDEEESEEESDESKLSPRAREYFKKILPELAEPNYQEIYEKAYFDKNFPNPAKVQGTQSRKSWDEGSESDSDEEYEEKSYEGKTKHSYPLEKWIPWSEKLLTFVDDIGEIYLDDTQKEYEKLLEKALAEGEKIKEKELKDLKQQIKNSKEWIENWQYKEQQRRDRERQPNKQTILARQLKARLITENPKLAQLDLKFFIQPDINPRDRQLIQKHPELTAGIYEKELNTPLKNGNIILSHERIYYSAVPAETWIVLKGKLVRSDYDNLAFTLGDYLNDKNKVAIRDYTKQKDFSRLLQIVAAFASD